MLNVDTCGLQKTCVDGRSAGRREGNLRQLSCRMNLNSKTSSMSRTRGVSRGGSRGKVCRCNGDKY